MEDSRIVQLYWDRNEKAIEVTAGKYGSYCFTIANNILGNHEDSEECVNDTYLHAWNTMPPHRPSMLSVFLGKITRNLSLDRFKRNRAAKRGGNHLALALDELSDIVSDRDDVEHTLDRKELAGAIDGFLKTLGKEQRHIFILRYWYFEGVGAIASRFHMTEGNVSVLLHRLRIKLRTYLEERGFEL